MSGNEPVSMATASLACWHAMPSPLGGGEAGSERAGLLLPAREGKKEPLCQPRSLSRLSKKQEGGFTPADLPGHELQEMLEYSEAEHLKARNNPGF